MNIRTILAVAIAFTAAACAQQPAAPAPAGEGSAQQAAPARGGGGGLNGTPEQQAKQGRLADREVKIRPLLRLLGERGRRNE